MVLLAWINLALAFLLELAALFLLGYWGFHLPVPEWGRWAAGLGAPLLFLTAWTLWAAPKAQHRLQGWKLWAYKAAAFNLAAWALAAAGRVQAALVFEGLVLVNLVLLWLWRRFEPS